MSRTSPIEGRPPRVLCIGESMVLITPTAAEPLAHAAEVIMDVAGAESTVALYLNDLGVTASWASRVGDDPLGRRIVSHLRGQGVDVSLVAVDPDRPTGVLFKDPGRSVHYYRAGSAASALSPADLGRLRLHAIDLVHVTGITAALSPSCDAFLDRLLAATGEHGPVMSFDVNHRAALWSSDDAPRRLAELADAADIVFVGRDEAQFLWGTDTPDRVRAHLRSPTQLVVKDAEVGATAYTPQGSTFVPARNVEVVEAIGAGDAFAAGYLHGYLAGHSVRHRLDLGHLTAARALSSTRDHVRL